jgi:hypothetical protein
MKQAMTILEVIQRHTTMLYCSPAMAPIRPMTVFQPPLMPR